MFEISFGELLVIGAVALIVLGPERLPTVARTIGALVGRAQRFVASVKSDIQQQSQMAGLQELQQEMQQAAAAFRHQVETEVAQVRETAREIEHEASVVAAQLHDDAVHSIALPEGVANLLAAADAPAGKDDNQLDLFDQPATAPTPSVADKHS
ncbi:Sec-independent protein translocase protein TatB [Vogesella oryzae]|uniref:Sec-independent protein translocase protein TatB n=1 Tax=Vogesella oryzae TaxID=1735285 RepID=UPI001582B3FB|nr:Sec-independent protein translocase protein TatB [Vogesella oryzae]